MSQPIETTEAHAPDTLTQSLVAFSSMQLCNDYAGFEPSRLIA
jgi:hypothetical protein